MRTAIVKQAEIYNLVISGITIEGCTKVSSWEGFTKYRTPAHEIIIVYTNATPLSKTFAEAFGWVDKAWAEQECMVISVSDSLKNRIEREEAELKQKANDEASQMKGEDDGGAKASILADSPGDA